jgi:hypothetical protein
VRNYSPASKTPLGWEGPGWLGWSCRPGWKVVVLVAQGPHDDDALGGSELLYLRVEGIADPGRKVCDERALVADKPARQVVG